MSLLLNLGLNNNKGNKMPFDGLDAVSILSLDTCYTSYSMSRNKLIRVIRASDSAELDISIIDGVRDNTTLLSFGAGTNVDVISIYQQKEGASDVTTITDRIRVVTAGALVSITAKYCCYEPYKSSLSLNDQPLAQNGRMKNLSCASYVVMKDDKTGVLSSFGFTSDYVFPVKCSAGLMDFGWTNLSGIFWYLVGGTTSTNARPAATLGAGVSYSFGTNMLAGTIELKANSTNVRYIGNTIDIPKLTNKLDLYNIPNINGNVNNLSKDIKYLNVAYCVQLTGTTNQFPICNIYFRISGLNLITGDISLLPKSIFFSITYIPISGIYTPLANSNEIYIQNTSMSSSDTDNTLIAIASMTTIASGGILQVRNNRTSASDLAVASLAGKFTITYV